MIKYRVTLTAEERKELESIVGKGSHKSQKVLNALILLNVDENQPKESKSTNEKISKVLQISMKKIDRIKKRFVEEGLDIALCGHPKEREYEKKVDGDLEAKLITLACSEAPDGFSRWSLRLLADKAVELAYVESISYETVRRVLKKRVKTVEEKRLGYTSIAKR
jgi:transposase